MEENTNGGIPTPTPSADNGGQQDDKLTQEKVNNIVKSEKDKFIKSLGYETKEELRLALEEAKANKEKLESVKDYDALKLENIALKGEKALAEHNVPKEYNDLVATYFKGKGLELNSDNLKKVFEEQPILKEQWVKKEQKAQKEEQKSPQTPNIPKVNTGVPPTQEELNEKYYEILKSRKRSF